MADETELSLTDFLRTIAYPRGTANVVGINTGTQYYDAGFVKQCIDDIDRIGKTAIIDNPSPLERLGLYTLVSYAEMHGYKATRRSNT